MAFLTLNFHSDALGMASELSVILPESAKTRIGMEGERADTFKTLYLLHGLSDDNTIWARRTSIERYAARYGIAVVMPNAHRSWYCDMAHGGNYYTYIAKEVPAVCRSFFCGMSSGQEMNYIAGLSMGGYGALKIALRNPDAFGGVASFSGAMDPADPARIYIGKEYWEDVFGPLEKIAGSENDVYALAEKAVRENTLPKKIYLSCGTEDPLLPCTRKFGQILTSAAVPHRYREAPGIHNWDFWDGEIERTLAYFFGEE